MHQICIHVVCDYIDIGYDGKFILCINIINRISLAKFRNMPKYILPTYTCKQIGTGEWNSMSAPNDAPIFFFLHFFVTFFSFVFSSDESGIWSERIRSMSSDRDALLSTVRRDGNESCIEMFATAVAADDCGWHSNTCAAAFLSMHSNVDRMCIWNTMYIYIVGECIRHSPARFVAQQMANENWSTMKKSRTEERTE